MEGGVKLHEMQILLSFTQWRQGLPERDRVLFHVKLKQSMDRISFKMNAYCQTKRSYKKLILIIIISFLRISLSKSVKTNVKHMLLKT